MSTTEVCAWCRRAVRLRGRVPEGRICSNCMSIRRSGICSRCGEHRRIDGVDPAGGRWCERCRNRHRRQDDDRQRRVLLVAAVRKVAPELGEDDVLAAIARAAASRRALRWLANHIRDHPQALTEPTSGPRVVGRLLTELAGVGARLATPYPACPGCGRHRPRKARGLCVVCYDRATRRPCDRCGTRQRPYRREPDGTMTCQRCVRRLDRQEELDQLAATIGQLVTAAIDDITPASLATIIDTVAAQPHRRRHLRDLLQAGVLTDPTPPADPLLARFLAALRTAGADASAVCCLRCQRPTENLTVLDGAALCWTCARTRRRQAEHQRLVDAIVELVTDTIGGIAPDGLAKIVTTVAGWQHPQRLYDLLQTGALTAPTPPADPLLARFVAALRAAGADLPAVVCTDCHQPADPVVISEASIRCRHCAKRHSYPPRQQRPRGACIDCHKPDRLLDQDLRCRYCREWQTHRCHRCDQIANLTAIDGQWLCHRCVLADELDTLLSGTAIAGFDRLRQAILAADNPQQIRRKWLADPTVTDVLGQLAAGNAALEHASLDRLAPPSRGREHLRALLVAAGLLPDIDRTAERLETAALPLLEKIGDPADRVIVRAWLTWQVLPRIRRRIERGQSVEHSGSNARRSLARVVGFLAQLHADGRRLADCRQQDIDRWFAQPGAAPRQLRAFLAWAQRQGHLPRRLELPANRTRRPSPPTADRAGAARRLLTDDTIPTDDRVAGALVVFYAQPVTRIAALTTHDLHTRSDGTTTITLAGTAVELLEPFATLARQLPLERSNGVTDQLRDHRWLFPGKRAGRHLGANVLGTRLRALDIPPRLSRTTALRELAVEIPPAILADLVGISPGSATTWTAVTGGDWAAYAASRAPS